MFYYTHKNVYQTLYVFGMNEDERSEYLAVLMLCINSARQFKVKLPKKVIVQTILIPVDPAGDCCYGDSD